MMLQICNKVLPLHQHKQIEHENRDSNRPEFRNYNFHFTSKEMKNYINELLAERDYWLEQAKHSRERCQVHANMVSQLAEKLERKEALNDELLKENQELKARIEELENEIKVLQQFDER